MAVRSMPRFGFVVAAFATVAFCSWARADEATAKVDAGNAASTWIHLVDEGAYAQSWSDASTLFRGAIDKSKWVDALNTARKPLGRVLSRKVIMTNYVTHLPGVPEGEYVEIRYATSFAVRNSSSEIITLMLEKDGVWRPALYLVR
ncbi:MAG: DUF4019 domain-containing protein [Candidatus Binataceae bacterium]